MRMPQDIEERLTTDMVAAAQRIQCSPVLTLHGSADDTIPVRDAKEFAKHILHHTLRVVDGADHRFTQHGGVVVNEVVSFMTEGQNTTSADVQRSAQPKMLS